MKTLLPRTPGFPRTKTIHLASLVAFAVLGSSTIACSSSDSDAPADSSPDGGAGSEPDLSPLGGQRPVTPVVPASYRSDTPTPLLILLHGFGVSGLVQSLYFGLPALVQQRGFILLAPDGTFDKDGSRFWNATDACCDFDGAGVDDVAYIGGLIDEAKARFNVDPKRVFLMGHSNGGFMSFRMACDRAAQVAAIASLAGASYDDVTKCHPAEPVAVLQIHGTADDTILFDGGSMELGPYPSATKTVSSWAQLNGCSSTPDGSAPLRDLVTDTAGAETSTSTYADQCLPGGHAELWAMEGAGHIPGLGDEFTPAVLDFLFAHSKP